MSTTDNGWRDVDFRPDPCGWRVAYLPPGPDEAMVVRRIAGWLIQQDDDDGARRIVAVLPEADELTSVECLGDQVGELLEPGAPPPTPEQERVAREAREAEQKQDDHAWREWQEAHNSTAGSPS